ncbi:MAG: sulfite exporter TauE/SafE family protein, partial [Candidatus Aminicenantes bacterium]|nr:sulfite exporter TauE/SafE family protein [Candidatus Aminicenantes bacterium]
MDFINILAVCIISFVVSIFSVSVGGTSLITVPVLISLGMTSKVAIATNMFALIFLSISGAAVFRKEMKTTHVKMIIIFSILTLCGSLLGANLVLAVDKDILKRIIAIIICVIAFTFLLKRDLGNKEMKERTSKWKFTIGTLAIFFLGIYGGFFSGGYVTLLSYVLILIFGFNFLQVAFITKVFNI